MIKEELDREFHWHQIALGIALGYLLLHYLWVTTESYLQTQYRIYTSVVERDFLSDTTVISQQEYLNMFDWNVEPVWPVGNKEGCYPVMFTIEALPNEADKRPNQYQNGVTLCHQ